MLRLEGWSRLVPAPLVLSSIYSCPQSVTAQIGDLGDPDWRSVTTRACLLVAGILPHVSFQYCLDAPRLGAEVTHISFVKSVS